MINNFQVKNKVNFCQTNTLEICKIKTKNNNIG